MKRRLERSGIRKNHAEIRDQISGNRSNKDDQLKRRGHGVFMNKRGMEMVQVAILIALAVALGIIFRTEITKFVNNTFSTLNS